MDAIFGKMDQPSDPNGDAESKSGVQLSNLSDLPDPQFKIVRYIMGHNRITHDELLDAYDDIFPNQKIDLAEFEALIQTCLDSGYFVKEELSDGFVYRTNLQRKKRKTTMDSIFSALDSPTTSETDAGVNPESRRTRSRLADSLLADLSQPLTPSRPQPPDNEMQRNESSLMSDLLNTGRTSMNRRTHDSAVPSQETAKPPIADSPSKIEPEAEADAQSSPKSEKQGGFMARFFKKGEDND